MNNIEWKDGAVCYGDGRQWFANTDYESDKFELSNDDGMRKYSLYGILNFPKDFQLNEIRTGDFIPASELDTEQKYNEVVDVFGLFGFGLHMCNSAFSRYKTMNFTVTDGGCCYSRHGKRQLTYQQIIAIGKLKRMMLDKVETRLIENASMMKQLRNSELDEPESTTSNLDDFIAVKHESAVTAMEKLGYKYCKTEKQWYKEVKEWV